MHGTLCCSVMSKRRQTCIVYVLQYDASETEAEVMLPTACVTKTSPICHARHVLKQVTWQNLSCTQMFTWMLIKIDKPHASCLVISFDTSFVKYLLSILVNNRSNTVRDSILP